MQSGFLTSPPVCITTVIIALGWLAVGECFPVGNHPGSLGRVKRQAFLQDAFLEVRLVRYGEAWKLGVHQNGTVHASHKDTDSGILKLTGPLKHKDPLISDYFKIKGIKSNIYICMDKRGNLYGSEDTEEDECNFIESQVRDNLQQFSSAKYRCRRTQKGRFVSINRRGNVKGICNSSNKNTQFLRISVNSDLNDSKYSLSSSVELDEGTVVTSTEAKMQKKGMTESKTRHKKKETRGQKQSKDDFKKHRKSRHKKNKGKRRKAKGKRKRRKRKNSDKFRSSQ